MNNSITLTPDDFDAIAERAGVLIQKQYPSVDYLHATVPQAIEQALRERTGFVKVTGGDWMKEAP